MPGTTVAFESDDGLPLSLLRFRRGATGHDSVLLIPGLAMSSAMFTLPEHENLVSYLLDHGFGDVWCLDGRMSSLHNYDARRHGYTLDDIALFDFPPALATVRRHTGDRPVHVVAHGLGATAFTMALFAKVVDGVSSVVANSAALTPRILQWPKAKLAWALPVVERVFRVPSLDPRWRVANRLVSLAHPECDVPACHMLSAMWGWGRPALYNHENLADVTHRRIGDLYGPIGTSYLHHVRKMLTAGRAVKFRAGDPRYARLPDDYFEHAADIDTPVLFMTGEENRVFIDSNIVCHERLMHVAPGRHGLRVIRGYGHVDPFIGARAARDVFPRVVEFLTANQARSG